MIVVAGRLTVDRRHVAAVTPHMLTMAEASRAEPGCLRFAYLHDDDDPGTFYVCEAWRTESALALHKRRPHRRAWRSVWRRYGVTLDYLHELTLRTSRGAVLLGVGVVAPDPRRPASFTAATDQGSGAYAAHCLTHSTRRGYSFKATALDAAEHPGEWCAGCRTAPVRAADEPTRGDLMKWAVVLAFFDATGVPDDAGSEDVSAPRQRRRASRARRTDPPHLRAVDDPDDDAAARS